MLLTLANNQALAVAAGATVSVTTDPVPLNGADRMAAIITVSSIFNAAVPGLTINCEVSIDGVTWRQVASTTVAVVGTTDWLVPGINYGFMRLGVSLTCMAMLTRDDRPRVESRASSVRRGSRELDETWARRGIACNARRHAAPEHRPHAASQPLRPPRPSRAEGRYRPAEGVLTGEPAPSARLLNDAARRINANRQRPSRGWQSAHALDEGL